MNAREVDSLTMGITLQPKPIRRRAHSHRHLTGHACLVTATLTGGKSAEMLESNGQAFSIWQLIPFDRKDQ